MKTLLIALYSPELSNRLSGLLADRFLIHTCDDGNCALQALLTAQPDVTVVDLMLPGMDGVSVLRAARDGAVTTKVVAVSAYTSDYICHILTQLQVQYFVQLPCDARQLAARVLEVAHWEQEEPALQQVQAVLTTLGFKSCTGGYAVVEQALLSYVEQPGQPVTTRLYPQVAQTLGTSPAQVERALRTAIHTAWKGRDEALWRVYFSTGKNGKVPCPSNSVFLAAVSAVLNRPRAGLPRAL